jgi:hypothetical protein
MTFWRIKDGEQYYGTWEWTRGKGDADDFQYRRAAQAVLRGLKKDAYASGNAKLVRVTVKP